MQKTTDARYSGMGLRLWSGDLPAVTKLKKWIGEPFHAPADNRDYKLEVFQRPTIPWSLACESKGLSRNDATKIITQLTTDNTHFVSKTSRKYSVVSLILLCFMLLFWSFFACLFMSGSDEMDGCFMLSMCLSGVIGIPTVILMGFVLATYWEAKAKIDVPFTMIEHMIQNPFLNECMD